MTLGHGQEPNLTFNTHIPSLYNIPCINIVGFYFRNAWFSYDVDEREHGKNLGQEIINLLIILPLLSFR